MSLDRFNRDPRTQSGNPLLNYTTAPVDYDYSYNAVLIDNYGTYLGKPVRQLVNETDTNLMAQRMRYQSGNFFTIDQSQLGEFAELIEVNPREKQIWHFQRAFEFTREQFDDQTFRSHFIEMEDKMEGEQAVTTKTLDGGYVLVIKVVDDVELFDSLCEELENLSKGYVKI